MISRNLAIVAFAAAIAATGACANATPSPKPHGAEVQFVSGIQKDLGARFATPADAQKAGYFRYTNEDDTGAISYANLQWTSNDPQRPSQLWYDVKGNLLGADFSRPYVAGSPPSLWGIDPARWMHIPAHVHYVTGPPDGPFVYEQVVRVSAFEAAGGNINDPQAATLVKMGKASDAAHVAHVFLFPNIWDLVVWVKSNPDGAFADRNPLVKPSTKAASGSM